VAQLDGSDDPTRHEWISKANGMQRRVSRRIAGKAQQPRRFEAPRLAELGSNSEWWRKEGTVPQSACMIWICVAVLVSPWSGNPAHNIGHAHLCIIHD